MIVITIEGGLVQGISSDDPAEQGKEVVVINYDAEGADPEEIHQVPQGDGEADGEAEDATIGFQEIGTLFEPVGDFVRGVLRKESGEERG